MAERERQRYRFFEGLLEHAKQRTSLHANISPSKQSWVAAGSGISGVAFTYVVRQRDARVELYIDTPDGDRNQRIFEALSLKKERIEEVFGHTLVWDTKEGRRACRIQKTFDTGGYRDEDVWEAVYDKLAQAMAKLEEAMKPHLKNM